MKYVNGNIVEETPEELHAMALKSQKEALTRSNELRIYDLLELIFSKFEVVLPDGSSAKLSDLQNVSVDLPYKVGYKWELVPCSGNSFAYQLVKDPECFGAAERPFIYYEGVPMIDNAFYDVDGVSMVCMNGQLIQM